MNALWDDLRERVDRIGAHLARIDFIVFTGDLAYHGLGEEYELAREHFLDPLIRMTGIDARNLFIVPGNHDIRRDQVTPGAEAIANSLTTRDRVTTLLAGGEDRDLVFRRLGEYLQFFRTQFPHLNLIEDAAHCYVTSPIGLFEPRIAILGLNSAWLAYGDEGDRTDKGRLAIGEIQAYEALERASAADVRIAAVHHPFDWLRDNDDTQGVGRLLLEKCRFILRGHLHRPDTMKLWTLWGESILIPAGAIYDGRKSTLGYNIVQLDVDAGRAVVHLRRYNDERLEWQNDTISTGDKLGGTVTVPIVLGASRRVVVSKKAQPRWPEVVVLPNLAEEFEFPLRPLVGIPDAAVFEWIHPEVFTLIREPGEAGSITVDRLTTPGEESFEEDLEVAFSESPFRYWYRRYT